MRAKRARGSDAAKLQGPPRSPMRALLIAALLVAPLVLLAPTASACCHILYYREDVGPCHVEWKGDGLRLETEYAEAGCLGHDTRIEP